MAQDENWWESDAPVTPAAKPESGDWWKDDKPTASAGDRAKDAGLALAKGVVSVPEAAVGLANIATGGRTGKFLENEGGAIGFRPKQAKEFLGDLQSDAFKDEQRRFQEADGILAKTGAALTNPALIANTVAESVPLMLGGGAVARGVGKVAPSLAGRVGTTAAGEGAVMAGSQAEQIRQETDDGLLTPKQAALAAGTGVIGAGLGVAGARAARALGVGDVDQMIAQGVTQGVARPGLGVANRAGRGALTEGVFEELPQSLAETGLQNIALDRPVTEGMTDAAVLGTLAGGVMGGGAGVVSGLGQRQDQPGQPEADPFTPAPDMAADPLTGEVAAPPQEQATAGLPADSEQVSAPAPALPDAGITDITPNRETQTPSQAMGIDPNAGPLSKAAATAVDTGVSQEMQAAQAAQQMAQAEQEAAKIAARQRPKAESPGIDKAALETRTDEELRGFLRSAQNADVRKAVSAELAKRKQAAIDAMPDPLQPSLLDQPEPPTGEPTRVAETAQAVQSRQEEPPAPAAQPAGELKPPRGILAKKAEREALGRPLTDTGAGVLGSPADPLQAVIQGENDARRATQPAPEPSATNAPGRAEVPQATGQAAGPLTYETAKAARDAADARVKTASAAMTKYPKGVMGITPDEVKATPEWKADKREMDAAMSDLQKANETISKNFAKESRADRDERRKANVQNPPQGTAGTQAQAAPVEARAPEGGDAAAAGGVPAEGGGRGAQADGMKPNPVREIALKEQRDAGWNPDWPFVPADLTNADFRELIRSDPSMSDAEKASVMQAGFRLGVVPKSEAVADTPDAAATGASDGQAAGVTEQESVVVRDGKGLIKGKYLVDVDGDLAPGGPWATPEQAQAAGEEWKRKTIQNAKDTAQERVRWDSIAEKFKDGKEVTTAEIESLGLKAGTSDVRWFFPIAARLFNITSRDIRPLVKELIRDSFTDMGAKREFVPTRKALQAVAASTAEKPEGIAEAANQAATSPKNDLPQPTDAQKEAGNYQKGHKVFNGFDISIENPAGSKRRPEWPPLKNHYGYFKGSTGADKDHVDVFLTDRADDPSLPVFVVDQVNRDGSFDEHKIIMGTANEAEARATYLQNYEKGWTGLGAITQMSQDEFKAWVRDPAKTKKPVALKRGVLAKMAEQKAKREAQEPFTHSGLKIRPSRVKVGDDIQDRWVVQSPENAERETRGERQIGGDRILDTREEAIKTAEQEVKRYADDKAYRAEFETREKAERDAAEAKKQANRGKSIVERRVDAVLDKPTALPPSMGLGNGSKREAIQKAVEQGRLIREVKVRDTAAKKRDEDAITRVRGAGYMLGLSNENIPVVKAGLEAQARLKENKYEKSEYRIYAGDKESDPFREISKTEYDYAQRLIAESQPAEQAPQAAQESAEAPQKAEEPAAGDDRNSFTLERLNRETNQMEPVTFERGEYITYKVGNKDQFGEIDGISQARREFSVDGLWHPMGFAYKAERPAAPKPETVPLSSVIDKVNAKNGEGLTEADRVPEKKPASKTPTVDRHNELMKAVRDGKATAEQFKSSFEDVVANKPAIVAELSTKTKAQLLAELNGWHQQRYANENKAEVVDALYRDMVGEYVLGESLSYGMGKGAYEAAVRAKVEATDADKLTRYVEDRRAAIAEAMENRKARATAMENPQTLDDFRSVVKARMMEGQSRKEAFLSLTPEQRIKYDELEAESTREARETRKRAQKTEVRAAGQTTGGEIIATKHTKTGADLYVVQLSDRLSREDYTTVLASAKRMGGWYSSFRGNGAVPGFQFKTRDAADAFLKLAGGDTTDAKAQAEQRRDAFADDRSQSAVERLNEMAEKIEASAQEDLNRDRKTNTARRARFAASAERAAEAEKALARTMRNIAKAIDSGKAKFLDAVRMKTQVEVLTGYVRTAKDNELRAKYPAYADQEKRRGEPPTAETADFAEFPTFTAFRSDLASLARQMIEVEGTKKLGTQLMKLADDVTDAYIEFAKQPENLLRLSTFSYKRGDDVKTAIFASRDTAEQAIKRSGLTGKAIVLAEKRGVNRVIMSPSEAMNQRIWDGDGDKRISLSAESGNTLVEAIGRRGDKKNGLTVPWQFQTAYDRRKALARMGIETPSEFRSALREFIALQERATANKVREMELAMVGKKNDGLDFFPTPQDVADQMVEAADIQPDMAVLEPSAGMGHIADRIRAAGAEPDLVELSPERRELLLEKGYHLAEVDDFTAMQPRKFFTYGDLFRAPDGTEGIMRGVGHMGSQRVRLEDEQGNRLGLYDRHELKGIGHRGSWSGYDRIIMNPPFSNRQDAEHVQHAYTLLKPGGRVVAIMGEGVFFGKDKKAQDFREWMDSVGGTDEKLPAGSFMDPSLPVNTGVSARMVVIDKPEGDTQLRMADPTQLATPSATSTATQANQVIVESLSDNINARRALKGSPAVNFQAVEPADGTDGQLARAIAKTAKRIFNREVVYVRFDGQPLFNGAVSKLHPGKIFINIDSERPMMAVLGHELLHELAKSNPGTYANLSRRLDRVMRNQNIYSERLKAKYRTQGQPLPGDIMEELEADIVGDNFMDPLFWQEMSQEQPGLFRAMANQIIRWLDKVAGQIRRMNPFGTEQYLTDIAAARSAVAEAMREFSQAQVTIPADSLSIADRQDQTDTPAFKKWFGDSKVVDADGKPLVVYHGTTGSFDAFKEGTGWFTVDPGEANFWGGMKADGANVMPAYLSIKNPRVIQASEASRNAIVDALSLLRGDQDGVLVMENGRVRWAIVTEPTQVKSATGNRGTFDPSDPDTRFSVADTYREAAPRAAMEMLTDISTSQRGFNRWWHRTVGTQLHKAKINKSFGKVYYAVQDFMKDVSRMATLSADLAPDLLPQLDTLADARKIAPQLYNPNAVKNRKADMKAASDALFDGTLRYTRDSLGAPVLATKDGDKGIVWTTAELKARGMSDEAVKLYQQSRLAINQSLDNLLASDVFRSLTAMRPELLANDPVSLEAMMERIRKAAASDTPMDAVSEARGALDEQAAKVEAQIAELKAALRDRSRDTPVIQAALDEVQELADSIKEAQETLDAKVDRIADLKASGYAPLMRFGEYTVDALDAQGNRVFFGMYESQFAANRAARKFRADGLTVNQGVQSKKEFELLKGVSPETAMLFADMMGMEKNAAMQDWLQKAVAQQSALKRHIRRKGIEGFENDASRVVAAFITSNSRAASRALHGLRIQESVENVKGGDVKDEAIALAEYVNNPKEEAQAIRSLLFVNYIGGSVASAMVNLTQTLVQTFPFLSQYGGAGKAGMRISSAMRQALGKISDPELSAAVDRAVKEGVIKPQEVFQLQAEASRTLGSDIRVRAFLALWGSFFQAAEVYNRRVAFIAGYQTAKEQGIANPYAFAENAVEETQGTFNKGNRPDWARGALGSTVFTFKGFTIQYVEFLKRLPPKERAIALGVLVMIAGTAGLPFAGDAEDIIDTVAQQLGYNFTVKDARNRFLIDTFGRGAADFIQFGASPWLPFDVSQRLGMADLLPGTAVLKPSETRKEDQVMEVAGVAGSFVRDILKGEYRPIAIRNLAKAIEMYDMGIYRDTRGRKVIDVDGIDAAFKGIGLQPSNVAAESRAVGREYEKRALYTQTKNRITEQMALGQFEGDAEKVNKARQQLSDWNEKNPEARMIVSMPNVWRRVSEMRKDRSERFIKSAPKEIRSQTREALQ